MHNLFPRSAIVLLECAQIRMRRSMAVTNRLILATALRRAYLMLATWVYFKIWKVTSLLLSLHIYFLNDTLTFHAITIWSVLTSTSDCAGQNESWVSDKKLELHPYNSADIKNVIPSLNVLNLCRHFRRFIKHFDLSLSPKSSFFAHRLSD